MLAALGTEVGDNVIFFGGTALARSILPDGRLSEDIDLLALDGRTAVATHLAHRTGTGGYLRRDVMTVGPGDAPH